MSSTDTRTPVANADAALAWQPVPGAAATQYLLLERRSDPCSSHSALVRTPEALLVIDPGSAPDQAALISRLVAEAAGAAGLPVLIVLTHSHWDHLAALPALAFPVHIPMLVLAQGDAALTLARGDRHASLAFLFNAECPQVDVQVPLLSAPTAAATPRHPSASALRVEVVPDPVSLPTGRTVPADSIRVAGRAVARAFHTPGHSPDSICLQVGGLLWIGDLLLAANPAVAGVPGWNCQALLDSLQTVDELLATLPLEICCPGHGRCLPNAKSREVIATARAQAATLHNIATLDPERMRLLVEYSDDLLSEGLALFTIIAGRLYTVSFHLDALEESQTARDVLQALDIEGLDTALEELRAFATQFRKQHRLEMALPLKGVQTVGRIEKLFDTARLRGLIDPVLLRRTRHLLDDFMHDVRGIEPPATPQPETVSPIVTGLADTFTRNAVPAQELWDAGGDEQAFRQALTRRLAAAAAAVRLTIDLDIAPGLPQVEIDRARFEDTLHAILSEFAGAGATRVRIAAHATSTGCRIEVGPVPDRAVPCFTSRKIRFLDRGLRLGAARLRDVSTDTGTRLAMDLTMPLPG